MKHLMLFENFQTEIWYRGYTTETKNQEYTWITQDKSHAMQYADINKSAYGGYEIVDTINIQDNINLNDLYIYDMDEMITISDAEEFLSDVNSDYEEYVDIFDYEDEIPLSRLVNKILDDITYQYDGFKIKESGINNIYIKTSLIKSV